MALQLYRRHTCDCTGHLLEDVRSAEGRAERLFGAARDILERALNVKDLKTALTAIGAAVSVRSGPVTYNVLALPKCEGVPLCEGDAPPVMGPAAG